MAKKSDDVLDRLFGTFLTRSLSSSSLGRQFNHSETKFESENRELRSESKKWSSKGRNCVEEFRDLPKSGERSNLEENFENRIQRYTIEAEEDKKNLSSSSCSLAQLRRSYSASKSAYEESRRRTSGSKAKKTNDVESDLDSSHSRVSRSGHKRRSKQIREEENEGTSSSLFLEHLRRCSSASNISHKKNKRRPSGSRSRKTNGVESDRDSLSLSEVEQTDGSRRKNRRNKRKEEKYEKRKSGFRKTQNHARESAASSRSSALLTCNVCGLELSSYPRLQRHKLVS